MSAEQIQLTMIRGVVAGLPAEDQEKIRAAADELRKAITAFGDHARLALALLGAEMSAEA